MKYIAWLVGALVVVGAAYYFFVQAPAAPATQDEGQGATTQTEVSRSGSSSFADFATMSGDYQCEVSMQSDGSSSQGMVYISNGEVRGDFSSTVSGQTVSSSMLQTGGYVYTWSNLMPQGFKMVVTGSASATTPTQGSFDPSVGVDYDCDPWTRDSAKFVVPAEVTFMEPPMVQ